ncbi:MAG: radical SAM protein [Alphaproteobacteria bacterium]|nr:radical SAM protein [Alphaproteobacteria bacterium]
MSDAAAKAGSKPLIVGLAQINNSFSNHNYLPYSVALLQGYAQSKAADPSRYKFLMPLYKRIRVADGVAHMRDADIVGFSIYVWNVQLSLEIARRLKAERPDRLIVFGGPQVPDKPEAFLRANPFIDLVVHNEGEQTFLQLLEHYPSRDWSGFDGVSYVASDGTFVRKPNAQRFRDIAQLPSPFLTDMFEPLMAANPQETWIVLWETNRGCPFQCTFCDWGSATAAKVLQFDVDRLMNEIDWFSRHKIEFVFCCDANFGILPRDVEIAQRVAENKKKYGYPKALSVQNTKNATERAYLTQKILSDAGLNKGVALSLQSVDHVTLTNIKRQNISLDTYLELQKRFTRDNVETYSDLILGLPGETFESFVSGVAQVIESGQHNRIQFNNLSILPNAEMGDPAYQAKYGMVTIESRIINIHGAIEESEDNIYETQQLVIATHAMPPEDWRRTRSFAWMTALLHFDKLLQIPFIVTHELSGISYRQMIEAFIDVDGARFPLLAEIRDFFIEFARRIQEGGPEYVYSKDWLGIYWPADEYIFIKLTAEKRLDDFYAESKGVLMALIAERAPSTNTEVVEEAVKLNRMLVKQPFQTEDTTIRLSYDILPFYRNAIRGISHPLDRVDATYRIDRSSETYQDFQKWCQEVVWYGNKKGAYLYGNKVVETELAGHY